MATTTRVLTASVNGTVYTSNANGALEAIDTCHSGATAPTNEVANGKFWLDTSTTPGILKMYNNAAWEEIGGSTSSPTFATVTADNIGINTTSPADTLDVSRLGGSWAGAATSGTSVALFQAGGGVAGSGAAITIGGGNTSATEILFADVDDTDVGKIRYYHANDTMTFNTNGAESMSIDSSGNIIVTSGTFTVQGSAELNGNTTVGGTFTVQGSTELNGNTTVDGSLTVQGSTGSIFLRDSDVSASSKIWQTGENLYIDNQSTTGGDTYFRTDNGKIRQIIRDNGDISFRNTAGTVDGLWWDAADESLGIGTTGPTQKLEVAGNILMDATDASLLIKSGATGTTGSVGFTFNTEATSFGSLSLPYDTRASVGLTLQSFYPVTIQSTGDTVFDTAGVERLRIYSDGSMKTGTAADSFPSNNTSGTGVGITTAGRLSAGAQSDTCMSFGRNTTTGSTANFYYNGSVVGTISVTGSATAYNTSSDYRLKENVTPIQGASDIVKAMQPVTYTFKSDGSWHDGFLAHELQVLHPRAVIGDKDGMRDEEYEVTPAVYEDVIIPAVEAVAEVPAVYDDEGVLVSEMVPAIDAQPERTEQHLVTEAVMGTRSVPDYQGVDYSKLTPILTAALQEALNKIDALEARVAALEL